MIPILEGDVLEGYAACLDGLVGDPDQYGECDNPHHPTSLSGVAWRAGYDCGVRGVDPAKNTRVMALQVVSYASDEEC